MSDCVLIMMFDTSFLLVIDSFVSAGLLGSLEVLDITPAGFTSKKSFVGDVWSVFDCKMYAEREREWQRMYRVCCCAAGMSARNIARGKHGDVTWNGTRQARKRTDKQKKEQNIKNAWKRLETGSWEERGGGCRGAGETDGKDDKSGEGRAEWGVKRGRAGVETVPW